MKSFVISFALTFISCLSFAQTRQYLLAGQSNARGRGDATLSPTVAPMTSFEYHPNLDILFQLQDPVGVNSGGFQQAATGSAWPAFAKTYYDMTGDTTAMIPAARGGSGVHPISASSGANWSANGLLYSLCQFKVDQAIMLTGLPLDGIVWVQGEQDAARINFGAYEQDDYRDALIALIDRFRDDYGCAVPFYMVLLGANTEDPVEGYDAVRAAQVEVAAIHPHTYLIHENAVNFPALGWMLDNVHYTQDGYNEIGTVGAQNVVNIEQTYYTITKNTNDTICPGDSVTLSAPPMYTDYQWSNGDNGQEIFVTAGGEYDVTVTDDTGCAFPLRAIKVDAYPEQIRPSVSMSANDTLCAGDILTLTASPTGQDYVWSTGETTSSITVNTEGDFFVQTIDDNGCLSEPSDTISTTVISFTQPNITLNGTAILCEGDSVVLSAPSGFDTYLWSNGETTPNITVTTSGSFNVGVGLADCFSEPSLPVEIIVHPMLPAPVISTSGSTNLCEGDNVTLTASNEYNNYLWSTGETTQSITVSDSGIYACAFVDDNDCVGNGAVIEVVVNPLPAVPSISASGNTELCDGDEITLSAPPGFDSYQWSTGETTPSITVNSAGTFDVMITDANGCQSPSSAAITTTVNPLPATPLLTADGPTTFCEGDSVTLFAPVGFMNYQWSNGDTTQSITVYDANSYFCVVTDANGCVSPISEATVVSEIAAPAMPTISISGELTFCEGDSVTLTAPTGFSDYQWSNGETTQSITVTDSGIFDVIVSNNIGCTSPASESITVTSISTTTAPMITVNGSTMLCEGESLILTAPQGDAYEWSNGSITQSISVTSPDTYTCIITSADGCESPPSEPVTVTVNPLPATPSITPDNSTTFCEGESVTLSAPSGFDTYLWSNNETTQSITVSTAGTFDVIITDTNGCTSEPSASIITTVNPIPTASITAQSSTTFCEGENVVLTAPPGFDTYLWSNGETTQSITVTDAGTFDVIITDANGCESVPSAPITTMTISATTAPVITANGNTNLCEGESVTLSAPSGFDTYLWSNGETTQDITVNTTGTYSCIITGTTGCESPPSIPIAVTINPIPNTPIITPDNLLEFCEGESVTLTAPSGFDTYLWSNGETTESITVSTANTFDVMVMDANGCESAPSASISTIVNPLPTANITALSSPTFCEGESVVLLAPSGFEDYLWSNGETTQSITVTDSGTFDVIVTDTNGCTSTSSGSITTTAVSAMTAPIITANGDTNICQGESVTLSAPDGFSNYLWSNGAITQDITVSAPGMYTCIISGLNGCESPPSEAIEVTVNPLPPMPIITSNNANTFCDGESVTLTATAGFDGYLWSNGETTQSITVSTSGTFDVIVIDANGCESPLSEAITTNVTTVSPPLVTPNGATTFCQGDNVTLSAPAGFSNYQWSNGATTPSITISDSGTFTVIITDADGCESPPSDAILITVTPIPSPNITASSATTFCEGESVTLSAPPGFDTYLWSNGETTQDITVTDSGMFDVIITDANGCISSPSAPVNVTVLSIDMAPEILVSGMTTLCEGESVVLSAPTGLSSYLWSTGETTESITVSTSGTFTCEITNDNGCESPPSQPVTITVNPTPATPTVDASGPTSFCEGESVTLSAPSGFDTYLWSNGATTQSITVTDSGIFDVVVTDGNNCQSSASSPVNVVALSSSAAPEILVSGSNVICEGESVTLTAPAGLAGYLWSTGETTESITVMASGTFTCEITNDSGCISPASEPVIITVNPLPAAPSISENSSTTFCEGESVTLTAPGGFDSYLWSNGEITQEITVTQSGDYHVIVTNANGCMSPNSQETNVTVNALPVASPIMASGATNFCDGDSVILSAPNGFQNYQWSTGETTQSITVYDAGNYDYFVTDNNACISANSEPLTISTNVLPSAPEITASSSTTFCDGDSVVLSAPNGFSNYEWSTGETTQSVTIYDAGNYEVFVTNNNGCASAISEPVEVTVNPLPAPPAITTNGTTTFCEGESVTLSAPDGFINYEWSTGATTQDIIVTESGDYDVFVRDENGCISPNSQETTVTVNALPVASSIMASGATTFCDGDSVVLSAPSGFQNYEWSTGETTQSITVYQSGTFEYFITDENDCISTNSEPLQITVNDLPTAPAITASGATTFCDGDSVVLSAPPGFAAYEWSTGETTQSITVYQSGTYDYFVTNGNNCVSGNSSPLEITVNPTPETPSITASGMTTFCAGDSVILTAPAGFANYEWSTGATTQSITVFDSGDYDVFVINNSDCVSPNSQAINVAVNGLPTAAAIITSGSTTFCEGDSVILSAPEGFQNYEWSTGETTQSITVHNSGTFEYFLADVNGCVSANSEPLEVIVNELPPIPQIEANGVTEFCEGENVTISAPSGFGYLWSNGETTQDITVAVEGSYDVTISNANGCSSASTSSAKVVVHPLPPVPIVQPVGAPVFCEGDSVTLVVPGGFSSYEWSTGETTQFITVSETGAFFCTVTDVNGCQNVSAPFSTVENEELPIPEITFSGNTEFCEGGSVTLFAPSGYLYLWSNGETTQDITVTETSGPLSCIIMDNNGCVSEASDTTFVKVFSIPPVPTIDTSGLTTLCLGNTVELSAPPGFDSYMWSNGETSQTINVGVSGNYSVMVFNEDGCSNESIESVNITVNATPQQPTISVNGSTNFCDGESVTLSAPPGAEGYLWSNGETTQSIVVTETGTFSCVILDEFDCQSQSSVTVSTMVFDLPDAPAISLSDDAILCPGDTVILSAEPGFDMYFWSDGSVSEQVIATTDREYSYFILDENGCQSAPSDVVAIEVRPLPPIPNIHSSNDFDFCEGDSIALEADAGFLSYLWSTGDTSRTITVNSADEFSYTAIDGFSCEDAVSVAVTTGINPPPLTSIITQFGLDTLCANEAADRYLWYRNDTLTDFTTRCIAPELSGNWQVVGIVDNCLSEFSTAYEYTGRPPIDPNASPGLTVFPNPAINGSITIQTTNIFEDTVTLNIYDVLGRLLYRYRLEVQQEPRYELVIDIERLPDAVYVAVIDAGFSGRFVQKFIVDD